MKKTMLLRLAAMAAYNAYMATLHVCAAPSTRKRREFFETYKEGDLIMEITSIHNPGADSYRIGTLIERSLEATGNHEEQWFIRALDGNDMKYTVRLTKSEYGTLTPTEKIVYCWNCQTIFRGETSDRFPGTLINAHRNVYIYQEMMQCPICHSDRGIVLYETMAAFQASKKQKQECQLIEESEAERLQSENAGLSIKLKDALRQLDAAKSRIEHLETERSGILQQIADALQQSFIPPSAEMCEIFGSQITFHLSVKEEDVEATCKAIWENPEQYADERLNDEWDDFLKFLWVRFPDGRKDRRLADIANENEEGETI